MPRFTLLVALAFSCRRSPPSAGDDTHAGETGDDTATDDTAVTTDDTGELPPPPDFLEVAVDGETWGADGYEIQTWTLNPDAQDPYESLFEDDVPTFYLVRPADLVPGETLPVLVWFHGGAIGDDSSGELPYACVEERVKDNAQRAVTDVFVPTAVARRDRWAVLVPRNDWCDMWTGYGPDDPVDAERHYGYYHVQRVLDYVLGDGANFEPSGELYAWGTSMGGTAALVAASRYTDHGGFDAIVTDSAPSSMFEYYALNHFGTDDEILEHTFGGPPYDEEGEPTDAYQRYADASGETLISSGKLVTPLYVIWNSLDALSDPPHAELLIEAMEASYPASVRHGHHDFAHEAPGENYHTQSVGTYPPWGYTGVAMMQFLAGEGATWQELEGTCDDNPACEIGTDVTMEDARAVRDFSGAAVRVVGAPDGVGTAWCGALPADTGVGDRVTAALVAVAKATEDLPQERGVATLRYLEGGVEVGQQALKVSDFLPESTEDLKLALAQYDATRLGFTVSDPTTAQLCLDSHGSATLYLDAVIFSAPR